MRDQPTAAKIHSITWHEMHREATDLAARLANRGPWRGLITIGRGGLVPASIIARLLGVRAIETLDILIQDGEFIKGPIEGVKGAPADLFITYRRNKTP